MVCAGTAELRSAGQILRLRSGQVWAAVHKSANLRPNSFSGRQSVNPAETGEPAGWSAQLPRSRLLVHHTLLGSSSEISAVEFPYLSTRLQRRTGGQTRATGFISDHNHHVCNNLTTRLKRMAMGPPSHIDVPPCLN